MHKYLLKYVSDHGYEGYKAICQQKLLKSGKFLWSDNFIDQIWQLIIQAYIVQFLAKVDSQTSRQFPPTVLEWRANAKRVNMALEGKCSDGDARHGAVDSFTTAEEFAANILQVWLDKRPL